MKHRTDARNAVRAVRNAVDQPITVLNVQVIELILQVADVNQDLSKMRQPLPVLNSQ